MKSITNIIISHTIFLAMFALAAIAFAQEATSVVPPPISPNTAQQEKAEARRADMQAQLDARQAAIQERASSTKATIEARRSKLQARTQERIINLAANISNRMDATIARFENIAGRLHTRIEKLHDGGVDTASAETHLASAEDAVAHAKETIATIDDTVVSAVGSEDVRANWTAAKDIYTTVREDLLSAHSELRACVTALKEAVAAAGYGNGVSSAVSNRPSTTTESEIISDQQ